ncbi:taste receptor type 2 member 19-like [Eublepharis macularius]|uniref:Taste receptor type 2 n=1 Tax=Eublepharis macularius TaxID=481883 RepID=A0AA97IWE6_EUBMA|nr:taste receptor type 2 member 19-like [Eublepharis macularius]
MWMDVFILAVNCRDWMNKKRLTLTDRILTLQGSIRIWLACIAAVWYILEKFYPWIAEIGHILKVFMFILWNVIVWNLWLTASLCFYYCVKIADFSHPLFIRLKLRLSGLISTWLVGSLVLSLASSLPCIWYDFEIRHNGNLSNIFRNENASDDNQANLVFKVFMFILWNFIVCNLWLTASLCTYYCVKIADFSHPFFVHLKVRLSGLVSTWLLASLVLSLASSLPYIWSDIEIWHNGNISNVFRNKNASDVNQANTCLLLESLIAILGNSKLKNEFCTALCFAKYKGNAS